MCTDPELVLQSANFCLEGDWSWTDPKTLKEGVCVRLEHDGRTWVYKTKTNSFKVAEGIIKETDDSAPDMEEIS